VIVQPSGLFHFRSSLIFQSFRRNCPFNECRSVLGSLDHRFQRFTVLSTIGFKGFRSPSASECWKEFVSFKDLTQKFGIFATNIRQILHKHFADTPQKFGLCKFLNRDLF
jgi:hypothetical protein